MHKFILLFLLTEYDCEVLSGTLCMYGINFLLEILQYFKFRNFMDVEEKRNKNSRWIKNFIVARWIARLQCKTAFSE